MNEAIEKEPEKTFKGSALFVGKTTAGRVYMRQTGEKKFEISTSKRYLGSAESPAACAELLLAMGFRLKTPKVAPKAGEIATTVQTESDRLKEMLDARAKNS